jgi:hypothetical protein
MRNSVDFSKALGVFLLVLYLPLGSMLLYSPLALSEYIICEVGPHLHVAVALLPCSVGSSQMSISTVVLI